MEFILVLRSNHCMQFTFTITPSTTSVNPTTISLHTLACVAVASKQIPIRPLFLPLVMRTVLPTIAGFAKGPPLPPLPACMGWEEAEVKVANTHTNHESYVREIKSRTNMGTPLSQLGIDFDDKNQPSAHEEKPSSPFPQLSLLPPLPPPLAAAASNLPM